MPEEEAAASVFGYTLVNDWAGRSATGDPVEHDDGAAALAGPCIVTADELDPQTVFVDVRIDGGRSRRATSTERPRACSA